LFRINRSSKPVKLHREKIYKVKGPLEFNLTRILAGISDIITQTNISIIIISTFDTDNFLTKSMNLSSNSGRLVKNSNNLILNI